MITKEEFWAYEKVRISGRTNMFLTQNVIRLAKELCGVNLGKGVCIEIMHNYVVLKQRFQKEMEDEIDELVGEDVCEYCGGTGEITTMEEAHPGEPQTLAPIGTRTCICRLRVDDEMDDDS